jgi:hypothetical protein
MKWNNYKCISENTLDFLALHDCRIEHVSLSGDTLTLEMEFINVMPEHPLNEYPVAKCTNEAMLIFMNVQVMESFLLDFSEAKGPIITADDQKRVDYPIEDLAENFEILTFECVDQNNEGFTYHFMGTPWPNSKGTRRSCN